MSSLSLQSFSSSSTLSFFDLVVPPTLETPTTDDASLKIQQLPVKNLINQPKKGKPLLPGTCTVIDCNRKESSQWRRNPESLEKNARMCNSCYMKVWSKKNLEKLKARNRTWRKKNPEKARANDKSSYEKAKAAKKSCETSSSLRSTPTISIGKTHLSDWEVAIETFRSEENDYFLLDRFIDNDPFDFTEETTTTGLFFPLS